MQIDQLVRALLWWTWEEPYSVRMGINHTGKIYAVLETNHANYDELKIGFVSFHCESSSDTSDDALAGLAMEINARLKKNGTDKEHLILSEEA